MKTIELYTDGACSGNPGPGGWCAILQYGQYEKILSEGEIETTNNRMEMLAVIRGLQALKERCRVNIYSDSAYVVNATNDGWIEKWKSNKWNKGKVKNQDLWQELIDEIEKHEVTFIKVKGHSDNANNNRCDEIARLEIAKIMKANNAK